MTADRETLLRSLYDAFNARDIDTVVAACRRTTPP